ncbi:MAG TPA: PQQ-binding-like beta-propeller repeat protein [Gemmataceae bacterium]|nr:PQQ-binding-like beta-propeller repeat protein [Gemmataceae bacterium]
MRVLTGRLLVLLLLGALTAWREGAWLGAAEPWSTYRGNPQRTGNTDGSAGPARPRVLWVHRSADHFVAAPVPFGDHLYLLGFGAFNVPTLYCLATDPKAEPRVVWSKSTPYLKLPAVSSPAVADGKLIFGDGMHQTSGAVLHCLRLDRGLPVWQLPLPGALVHVEGAPTVVGSRVFVGGGAAGVLCMDLNRVTLDGKELEAAAVQKVIEQKWAELLRKYEEEKKKDLDFAVPPNEDQLPKPAPIRLWQQGKDKWHVDAPVAAVGDRVLAASAFLEKEQAGDRALYCLDARTGAVHWRVPLPLNPWGGPSVQGDVVVVGSSNIGYDMGALAGARGEVAAFALADGQRKWRKDVAGGVLGCVALAGGLAIATATDGKVRAFDLADGKPRWTYDAQAPLFAPAAVAAGTIYVGDLKGVVHAVNLSDGKGMWVLDLGADPAVKTPGLIYGGPVVHGGRLFVATCNLEGPNARGPTVVVCLGEK